MFKVDAKYHYPLRALIALAIGIAIYDNMPGNFNSWILVSIIMLLQSTTGATFKRASFRVFGTLLGVLIGMLIVIIIPYNKPLYFIIVLLDLFLLYYWLRISYPTTMLFSGIAVIILLTIFFASGTPEKAWEFAVARVFDTIIGAAVVIITSYLCWPQHTRNQIKKEVVLTINVYQAAVEKIVDAFIGTYEPHDTQLKLTAFYQKIKFLTLQADDASQEPGELLTKMDVVQSIINIFFRAYNHCISLQACLPLTQTEQQFIARFAASLNLILDNIRALFSEFTEALADTNKPIRLLTAEQIQDNLFGMLSEMYDIEAQQETYITTSSSGVKLTILFMSLRDLCIDLQYIFAALKQLKRVS